MFVEDPPRNVATAAWVLIGDSEDLIASTPNHEQETGKLVFQLSSNCELRKSSHLGPSARYFNWPGGRFQFFMLTGSAVTSSTRLSKVQG